MKRKIKAQDLQLAREGEGYSIHIERHIEPLPNGTLRETWGLDLAAAPVPPRQFWADSATVVYRDERIRWLFGQRRETDHSLCSLVAITQSPTTVPDFLKSCGGMTKDMEGFVAAKGLTLPRPLVLEKEPDQRVVLVANVIAVAFAGDEAVLDFYNMSPRTKSDVRRMGQASAPIDPIVRISLRTTLVMTLLNELQGIATANGLDKVRHELL